ncbi:MAG TPA: hypothetical protein VNO43_06425 [Candidatus Eisenbacteria bacterium]|nr:hypothetical protein [Candidatus Eisenbacteria bacterium]
MAYARRIRLDDVQDSLFQPDVLAERNYAKTLERSQHFKPEEQLMLAVLEDAIFCYQKYLFAQDRKGRALFEETEAWLLEEGSDWFFSFNNICEVLGFDPQYLRQGLLRWKEEQLARTAKISHGKKKKAAGRTHTVPYR